MALYPELRKKGCRPSPPPVVLHPTGDTIRGRRNGGLTGRNPYNKETHFHTYDGTLEEIFTRDSLLVMLSRQYQRKHLRN